MLFSSFSYRCLFDITWRCSVRNKELMCKATVLERFDEYHRGGQPHICNAAPGRVAVAEIRRDIKSMSLKRPFESAAQIFDDVMLDRVGPEQLTLSCWLNRQTGNGARYDPKNRPILTLSSIPSMLPTISYDMTSRSALHAISSSPRWRCSLYLVVCGPGTLTQHSNW